MGKDFGKASLLRSAVGFAISVGMFFPTGCAYHRQAHPAESPAPVSASIKGVVVSNFVQGRFMGTFTQSMEVVSMREAMTTRDVSFDISNRLNAMGIPSRPLRDAGIESLKEGEVLITGTSSKLAREMKGSELASTMVTFMSLFLIGAILPGIPFEYDCNYGYKFDITDGRGNILLSTQPHVFKVGYKSLYAFGAGNGCTDDEERNQKEYDQYLAGEIAKSLGVLLRTTAGGAQR
jgi:hypothetical protein